MPTNSFEALAADRRARAATVEVNAIVGQVRDRLVVLDAKLDLSRRRGGAVDPRLLEQLNALILQTSALSGQLQEVVDALPAHLKEHQFIVYSRLAIEKLEHDLRRRLAGPQV